MKKQASKALPPLDRKFSQTTEASLLDRARKGDSLAAHEIYTTYLQGSPSIQGLLRNVLRNPEDREEMLHEIFIHLISNRSRFRGDSRLSTYIYKIARMTVFQSYRRKNTLKRGKIYRIISDSVDVPDNRNANPEYAYQMKESRELLKQLITQLPENYRRALQMRIFQELTYEEIAHELNIPVNTVSTKIHKAKHMLTAEFKANRPHLRFS